MREIRRSLKGGRTGNAGRKGRAEAGSGETVKDTALSDTPGAEGAIQARFSGMIEDDMPDTQEDPGQGPSPVVRRQTQSSSADTGKGSGSSEGGSSRRGKPSSEEISEGIQNVEQQIRQAE